MGVLTTELVSFLITALVFGAVVGWLIQLALRKRQVDDVSEQWQAKYDDMIRQRDHRVAEVSTLRTRLESQEAVIRKHEVALSRSKTEIESAHEKEKSLKKDIFTLRGEREEFKAKMLNFQNTLNSVKQTAIDLQQEFVKSGDFYKGELQKSFEKRKELEIKLDNAKAEQDSFSNLLSSSRSEHESVNKMLDSAKSRLADLDNLEQNVIKLEAENAQFNHDARLAQQEIEVLQRDVAEMEELRVQNKELAHCLQSMESSRKQYEEDAKRYRDHADQTEQKSETLRVRLDEVEQNFAEIEKQQLKTLKQARKADAIDSTNGQKPPKKERDNLQEIVGIGRVFEEALHKLGVFNFRQIATFGPADIARVNQELKECRGRMEQDDWIGQARELHYNKYGSPGEN